jgi:DNA-binding response OmpR family regulator
MMPYDGYTLAKEIRENKKFLLYSYCKIDERDVLKAKAGADDYLNKPLIQKYY